MEISANITRLYVINFTIFSANLHYIKENSSIFNVINHIKINAKFTINYVIMFYNQIRNFTYALLFYNISVKMHEDTWSFCDHAY